MAPAYKIIQIAPVGSIIYGLGDDGELYTWNPNLKEFVAA